MSRHPYCRGAAAVALCALLPAAVAVAQEAAPVATSEVRREAIIREVSVTGTVLAPRSASLSAAIEGLVTDVTVEVGDRVEAGERLLQLDDELERYAREAAAAEVARARAELAEARRLLDVSQSGGARTNVPETEIRARESAVRVAEATLESREAEARRLAGRVARHAVDAPFAGVVSRRHAERGEWVEPGTAILELVDAEDLRIELEVPQDAFRRLDANARLEVSLGGDGGRLRPARIETVVPVSEDGARTFRVRARIPEGTRPLPGMSARGVLRIDTGERDAVVPLDALNRYPEGRVTVWVVRDGDEGPVVEEQRIRTGLRFGERVQVREGVEAGADVVVSGNAGLRDGQRVAPE